MCLLQILSPSFLYSHSLDIDFAEWFLVLMKSSLPYTFHGLCFWWCISKVIHHTRSHLNFLLVSSRSFVVFHFTYRAMIHFELISVKNVRSVSRIIFSLMDVQLFQHQLLKRLSLLHYIAFVSSPKISWLYLRGLFLGSHSVSLIYLSILSPLPDYLDYCSFRVTIGIS